MHHIAGIVSGTLFALSGRWFLAVVAAILLLLNAGMDTAMQRFYVMGKEGGLSDHDAAQSIPNKLARNSMVVSVGIWLMLAWSIYSYSTK